ncbi:MAG: hypothetical protein E6833_25760 [Bradyrhizobium sp.]|nr:hypothetical protein [Bradyrhizobium sp.]
MVRIDRKRHQLIESHAIFGIDVEQPWRDGGEPEPLLDHRHADEESGCNLLLGPTLLDEIAEGAELIEGLHVLDYASSVLLAG